MAEKAKNSLAAVLRIVVTVLKLALVPLASPKVRASLAAFISSYVSALGLDLSPEVTAMIVGVVVAAALAIPGINSTAGSKPPEEKP